MAIGQGEKPNKEGLTLTDIVNSLGHQLVEGGWCKKSEVKNIVIEALTRSTTFNYVLDMCQYIADEERHFVVEQEGLKK